jgi:alanyl-tRNA synthetase
MTHVLNYALRKVLCGGVNSTAVAQGMCDQKGSFVDDEKLRYTNLYLPS